MFLVLLQYGLLFSHCGKGAENCAFRDRTPNTLRAAVVTKGFPARGLKLSTAIWRVEFFLLERADLIRFFRRIRRVF